MSPSHHPNHEGPWLDIGIACGRGGFVFGGGNPQDESSKPHLSGWGPTTSFSDELSPHEEGISVDPNFTTVPNPNFQPKSMFRDHDSPATPIQHQDSRVTPIQLQDSPAGSRQKSGSASGSGNTNPNQGDSSSDSPQRSTTAVVVDDTNNENGDDDNNNNKKNNNEEEPAPLDILWQQTVGSFWTSPTTTGTTFSARGQLIRLTTMMQDACASSPCSPRNLSRECVFEDDNNDDSNVPGIAALEGQGVAADKQVVLMGTDRRHSLTRPPDRTHEEIEVDPSHHIQVRLPPQDAAIVNSSAATFAMKRSKNKNTSGDMGTNNNKKKGPVPVKVFEVKTGEAMALERSISELTMRSSYAAAQAHNNNIIDSNEVLRTVPEKSRRMAYYAVGKHHRNAGRGGNRRCYFTGKLILGGAPFYAGSVQQGLRTLVVFCLPSAVGLPDKEALFRYSQNAAEMNNSKKGKKARTASLGTILSVQPAVRDQGRLSSGLRSVASGPALHMDTTRGLMLRAVGRSGAASITSKSMTSKASMSRLSSLDDLSLSIDGDLDPNWGLDRDVLLAVLPRAGPDLLKQMADHYPDQFETLPVQVRQAHVWKLYVKFCFFSGLPIAEGELHYKVIDDIAEQVYGEEIALSHEVLLAATGKSSADILSLPNRTVLQYLRKHYSQQCGKLEDRVFERVSWERVAPEV